MENRERSVGARLGRALVVVVGVLGALAALDAVLMVMVLLAAAILGEGLNPYIGMVTFVALPFAVVFGGALAWAAFVVVAGRAPRPEVGEHHARL